MQTIRIRITKVTNINVSNKIFKAKLKINTKIIQAGPSAPIRGY